MESRSGARGLGLRPPWRRGTQGGGDGRCADRGDPGRRGRGSVAPGVASKRAGRPAAGPGGAGLHAHGEPGGTEELDPGLPTPRCTNDQSLVDAKTVRIEFFDKEGKRFSTLVAKTGRVHQRTNDLGGARRRRGDDGERHPDGDRLASLAEPGGKILSDGFVKVTRQHDVVTGYGFESDPSSTTSPPAAVSAEVRDTGGDRGFARAAWSRGTSSACRPVEGGRRVSITVDQGEVVASPAERGRQDDDVLPDRRPSARGRGRITSTERTAGCRCTGVRAWASGISRRSRRSSGGSPCGRTSCRSSRRCPLA